MNAWIYVILGILFWQTIVAIVASCGASEDTVYMVGAGIWTPILLIAVAIYEKSYDFIKNHFYKCLLVDSDGKLCYSNSENMSALIGFCDYLPANPNDYVDMCQKHFIWKHMSINAPSMRYVPMSVIRKVKAYKINKKTIESFKGLSIVDMNWAKVWANAEERWRK